MYSLAVKELLSHVIEATILVGGTDKGICPPSMDSTFSQQLSLQFQAATVPRLPLLHYLLPKFEPGYYSSNGTVVMETAVKCGCLWLGTAPCLPCQQHPHWHPKYNRSFKNGHQPCHTMLGESNPFSQLLALCCVDFVHTSMEPTAVDCLCIMI